MNFLGTLGGAYQQAIPNIQAQHASQQQQQLQALQIQQAQAEQAARAKFLRDMQTQNQMPTVPQQPAMGTFMQQDPIMQPQQQTPAPGQASQPMAQLQPYRALPSAPQQSQYGQSQMQSIQLPNAPKPEQQAQGFQYDPNGDPYTQKAAFIAQHAPLYQQAMSVDSPPAKAYVAKADAQFAGLEKHATAKAAREHQKFQEDVELRKTFTPASIAAYRKSGDRDALIVNKAGTNAEGVVVGRGVKGTGGGGGEVGWSKGDDTILNRIKQDPEYRRIEKTITDTALVRGFIQSGGEAATPQIQQAMSDLYTKVRQTNKGVANQAAYGSLYERTVNNLNKGISGSYSATDKDLIVKLLDATDKSVINPIKERISKGALERFPKGKHQTVLDNLFPSDIGGAPQSQTTPPVTTLPKGWSVEVH